MISAPTLSKLGLSSVSPATRSKWQASEDGAERQRLGEGCEGGGADRDLDHAGDMGPARRQKKAPRIGRAARGEVGGPREIATQRCDSATPSFIPTPTQKGDPKAALSSSFTRPSQPQSFDEPDQQSRNPNPHAGQPEPRHQSDPQAHGHRPFGGGSHEAASSWAKIGERSRVAMYSPESSGTHPSSKPTKYWIAARIPARVRGAVAFNSDRASFSAARASSHASSSACVTSRPCLAAKTVSVGPHVSTNAAKAAR